MKSFFKRNEEEIEDYMEEETDIIDLDETAGWSKLDVAEEIARQKAASLMEEIGDELAILDVVEEDIRIEELKPQIKQEADTYKAIDKNMPVGELQELSEIDLEEELLEEELLEDDLEIIQLQDDDIEIERLSDDDTECMDADEYEEDSSFGFFGAVADWFARWTMMDKIVAMTGVLVLAIAGVTIGAYAANRGLDKQVETFVAVGEQLETIGVVGQDKLFAVADAKKAMLEAAKLEEELHQEYEEKEVSLEVKVIMKMTSVQKDLKIKFINKKTGKLVGNVPFEVKITDSENKTYRKIDEDMDGIIYMTNLVPGDYSVAMVELADVKEYGFSTAAEKIKVKETIAYEKIDVTEEIKDQSEVDVSKEDTAQKTETEAVLTDTVEWVESTQKEIGSKDGYIQVDKSTIPDPSLSASLNFNLDFGVLRAMQQSVMATDMVAAIAENGAGTVSGNETETGTGTETENNGDSDSENSKIEVTGITLDKTELELKEGESKSLTVTITPEDASDKNVTWTSSDESIVTVSDGNVTAKEEGSATITVTAKDGGKTATCKVTVSSNYDPKKDTSKSLKDKSGNQMYILVDGEYVEAKVADYYKYDVFYKKENAAEHIYTGWQNLDGKTYYYDKNGNMVTGTQIIQGAQYNFNSDGTLNTGSGILGIDVSTWNGNIDWSKVKNSGVSYVIIRTGFRGSTQGALIEDNRFRQNIKGATNAGLKVGVYFFSQAINEVEAVEEASMVLSQVKGYNLSYPVFIDVEPSGGRADKLSSDERTKVINAFCQTIQNGGLRAGIYANKTWLSQKMNVSALSGYKIWLAQYNSEVTYGGRYDIWQYSDKGTIPGIPEKVDMNLSYLSY